MALAMTEEQARDFDVERVQTATIKRDGIAEGLLRPRCFSAGFFTSSLSEIASTHRGQ